MLIREEKELRKGKEGKRENKKSCELCWNLHLNSAALGCVCCSKMMMMMKYGVELFLQYQTPLSTVLFGINASDAELSLCLQSA
jgi:hypothetical protein